MKNLILLNLYMNLEYKDKYLKYKKKYFQLKQQLGGALTSEVTDFLKKKKEARIRKKKRKKNKSPLLQTAIAQQRVLSQPQITYESDSVENLQQAKEKIVRPKTEQRTYATVVGNTNNSLSNIKGDAIESVLITIEELENRKPTKFIKVKDKKKIYVYDKISGFTVALDLHPEDKEAQKTKRRAIGSGSVKTIKNGKKSDRPTPLQKNLMEAANSRNPKIILENKKMRNKKFVTYVLPEHEYKLFTYNTYIHIFEVKANYGSIKAKFVNHIPKENTIIVQPLKEIEGKIIDENLTEFMLPEETSTQITSSRKLTLDVNKINKDWKIIGYLDSEAKKTVQLPLVANISQVSKEIIEYKNLVKNIRDKFGLERGSEILNKLKNAICSNGRPCFNFTKPEDINDAELVVKYVVKALFDSEAPIDIEDKDKFNSKMHFLLNNGIERIQNVREEPKLLEKRLQERSKNIKKFTEELKTDYTKVGTDLFKKGKDENKITHVVLYNKLTDDYTNLLEIKDESDTFVTVIYKTPEFLKDETGVLKQKTGELNLNISQDRKIKVNYNELNSSYILLKLPLWLGSEGDKKDESILFKYVKERDVKSYQNRNSLYYRMEKIKNKLKDTNMESVDSLLKLLNEDEFYDHFIEISLSIKEICLKIKSKKLDELKEQIINYFKTELSKFLWDKDWENDASIVNYNKKIININEINTWDVDDKPRLAKLKRRIQKFLNKNNRIKPVPEPVPVPEPESEPEPENAQGETRKQIVINRVRKNQREQNKWNQDRLNEVIDEFERTDMTEKELGRRLNQARIQRIQNGGKRSKNYKTMARDWVTDDQKKRNAAARGPKQRKPPDTDFKIVKDWIEYTIVEDFKKHLESINLKKLCENIVESETYSPANLSDTLDVKTKHDKLLNYRKYGAADISKLSKAFTRFKLNDNMSDFEEEVKLILGDKKIINGKSVQVGDGKRSKAYIDLLENNELIKPKDEQKEREVTTPRISRSSSSSSDSDSDSDSSNQFSALTLEEGSINSKYKVKLIKL